MMIHSKSVYIRYVFVIQTLRKLCYFFTGFSFQVKKQVDKGRAGKSNRKSAWEKVTLLCCFIPPFCFFLVPFLYWFFPSLIRWDTNPSNEFTFRSNYVLMDESQEKSRDSTDVLNAFWWSFFPRISQGFLLLSFLVSLCPGVRIAFNGFDPESRGAWLISTYIGDAILYMYLTLTTLFHDINLEWNLFSWFESLLYCTLIFSSSVSFYALFFSTLMEGAVVPRLTIFPSYNMLTFQISCPTVVCKMWAAKSHTIEHIHTFTFLPRCRVHCRLSSRSMVAGWLWAKRGIENKWVNTYTKIAPTL